jgi:holliday junction DNA helicase RuvB
MQELHPIDLISLQETREETAQDFSPKQFDEFIGQTTLKEKLKIYTQAAKMRGDAVDHILFSGPPGLGKTTISQIMATEMNVGIKICSGPMLERTGDLVAILSGLEPKDILFIDEIHRTPKAVEEVLYSAMEQFRIDVIIGQGAGARTVNLPINPFTLIGATTKAGLLTAPLRSRFGINERLDFYNDQELQTIVQQYSRSLHITIEQLGALLLAKASRGTPRVAKKLTRRLRDFAQVKQIHTIDESMVRATLTFLGIDEEGLTTLDTMILKKMISTFGGGPVGLETIASIVGEDSDTIETVYEPFLMRKGYLERTPRGRQIPHLMAIKLKRKLFGQKALF